MSRISKARCYAVCNLLGQFCTCTYYPLQLVSQFTLYAKMKKGNKPDFHDAAKPDVARKIYDHFYNKMSSSYVPERVKNGVFQAMMEVELKNDGPVGVDYCSEDAVVHSAFAGFPLCAAIDCIANDGFECRSRSKSTRLSPRKNPSPTRGRTKMRAGLGLRPPRRLLNFKYRQNY